MALTRRGFGAQWVETNFNRAFIYFYESSSTLNSLINEQILHGKLQVWWKISHFASMVENFAFVSRKIESMMDFFPNKVCLLIRDFSKSLRSLLEWLYRKYFNPFCMAHTYLPILYDNVKLGNLKLPVKLPPASTHSWWFRVPICQSPVLSVLPNNQKVLNKHEI